MRKVGDGLSTPCLVALVQEGEITKEDVERHNVAKGGKTSAKNVADNAGAKAADDPKDVSKKNAQKKPKIAKTKIATDPANAKKVSKKAKAGSKALPEKPVKKADKNVKKTKKSASANTNPGGPNKGIGKKLSTAKNKKSVTKPAGAKPSATKASSKMSVKKVKKAKKVPEEQAP
ncbi:hypothetical protein [Hyphomicrobium facile]|uniref:1,4-alpha-glucan branching enzyme n=1 Tax=Hyphomicrobium facile TaxID=51670 RepID=A0A1I7MTX3_9HYPH|nr:hypothetical protein [Hyphomicrobium facile]SFV25843.1 1,4-alpha-glucan branching enzyme [Hyphomicrobium facile]